MHDSGRRTAPEGECSYISKPQACSCYNIYVTLSNLSYQMCRAYDDIVSRLLIVKKRVAIQKKNLLIISVCSSQVGVLVWTVMILIRNRYNLSSYQQSCPAQKTCLDWKEKHQRSLEVSLILKVKIPKINQLLNGFNLIAMLTSWKNSRKGIVLRRQLKTMSRHLEIFMFGEWQGRNSMALMTSVHKTCLTIRAKPVQVRVWNLKGWWIRKHTK